MDKIILKKIRDNTKEIISKMGIKAEIEVDEIDEAVNIDVETADSALLIGYRGENLYALEYIIKLISFKEFDNRESMPKIILDISGYKKGQSDKIKEITLKTAEKVIKYKRPEILRPMNAYERRLVHLALKDNDELTTESVGEDPSRRIIIKMK
jgi:spoIIIJ-associated protein